MVRLPVYLDHNATTPCDPIVVEAMIPYFTQHFGNAASRNHSFGWEAEEAVKLAREQVAKLIGADPQEIIFTSGATEADNLAVKGVYEMYTGKANSKGGGAGHVITTNIEHKAVLDACKNLEKKGADITYLKVKNNGVVDLAELEAAIKPTTILIAIMYANNELGTIMPIKEIGEIAKKKNIIFFSDATQATGKLTVDVNKDGIDLLAFSAHKMYGPKGIGALYVRRKNPRVKLTPQIDGGGHERGMRSGTLNVPGIAGFGKACQVSMDNMDAEAGRMKHLRDKLENALLLINGARLNGDKDGRLPHVTNISFQFSDGDGLIMSLTKDIAVSSGAACTSASVEPSYVLKAIGLSDEQAHCSIRFSLGRFTTEEEIDFAIEQVTNKVNGLNNSKLKMGNLEASNF